MYIYFNKKTKSNDVIMYNIAFVTIEEKGKRFPHNSLDFLLSRWDSIYNFQTKKTLHECDIFFLYFEPFMYLILFKNYSEHKSKKELIL